MPKFIHIRTNKFPILDGEDEEIVNPGTYGQAFSEYVQSSLIEHGYESPFVVCEDWGWWVEVKLKEKTIGLTCYREHDENTMCEFTCAPSLTSNRIWSWKQFRFIDMSEELEALITTLANHFESDPDIQFLGIEGDMPLY